MLPQTVIEYAQKCYDSSGKSLGKLKNEIDRKIASCDQDEKALMQLLYGTLLSADIGSVSFDVLKSYASHALFLYQNFESVRNLPDDIFLHFVFYPRINSEEIVECRKFFYEQLRDVTEISDPAERVLAVNRWCAGCVTYESSDDRTESPMTAYLSGTGRCGEESVFTVTALRSIGIPARQVYVPWWAHCDDNHAWVEVYIDGEWNYLGACEPEPVLNRGWFTSASSRAPLVHSRTFFDYIGSGMENEEYIGQSGPCFMYNQTDRYAQTGTVRIVVRNSANEPAAGAQVSFQIINMAMTAEIARKQTDANGVAELTSGGGTVCIEVRHQNLYAWKELNVKRGEVTELQVLLKNEASMEEQRKLDMIAPDSSVKNPVSVTEEQKQKNADVIAHAKKIRGQRLSAYDLDEYKNYSDEVREIFRLAGGNVGEIKAFLDEKTPDLWPLAVLFLKSLARKDYKDITCQVLNGHFFHAVSSHAVSLHAVSLRIVALPDMPPEKQDEQMFIRYVMCPRIEYEILEDWRDAIDTYFSREQKEVFFQEPDCLMRYINEHFPDSDGRYYDVLTMPPGAVLSLGMGDEKARNILFVAVMRTLGIPARLDPMDGKPEYYRNGEFHRADGCAPKDSCIHLIPETDNNFAYSLNYTLSRWEDDGYKLLKCADAGDQIPVSAGHYRLITSNRLPNGNQLVEMNDFEVKDNETKWVDLTLREAKAEDMLEDIDLTSFETCIPLQQRQILAYLDTGTEPTEHFLNELLESRSALDLQLTVVLQSVEQAENITFQKVLQKYPQISVVYSSFSETPVSIARSMYLEPEKWPLVILLDSHGHGRYGSCGYHVGLVELLLKLYALIC